MIGDLSVGNTVIIGDVFCTPLKAFNFYKLSDDFANKVDEGATTAFAKVLERRRFVALSGVGRSVDLKTIARYNLGEDTPTYEQLTELYSLISWADDMLQPDQIKLLAASIDDVLEDGSVVGGLIKQEEPKFRTMGFILKILKRIDNHRASARHFRHIQSRGFSINFRKDIIGGFGHTLGLNEKYGVEFSFEGIPWKHVTVGVLTSYADKAMRGINYLDKVYGAIILDQKPVVSSVELVKDGIQRDRLQGLDGKEFKLYRIVFDMK